MFCKNCGKEMDDTSKFCPYCGTVAATDGQNTAPAPHPSAPTGKKKGPVIALAAVLALVVVAVAVALLSISGLFSSPKGAVTQALHKTAAAYSEIQKSVMLSSLSEQTAGQPHSQNLEWELKGLDLSSTGDSTDYSFLEGLGLRACIDMDLTGQQLGVSMTPFYGAADLLTAELAADGANLYLGSPELTGGSFYGLHTDTLGQDLAALGVDMGECGGLSFNLFELIEAFQDMYKADADSQKVMTDAIQALNEAMEIEKAGSETIDVNGYSTDCTVYRVLIPQAAMEDFLAAAEDMSSSTRYMESWEKIYGSLGLPDQVVDSILQELEGQDSYGAFLDLAKTGLDALGDLEMQFYLKGGYVMAIVYETELEGEPLTLGLYLGGGTHYVDDLRLEVTAGQNAFTLTSTGDHSARDGVYTDSSVLRVKEDGEIQTKIASELSYAPKADSNNLTWHIDAEEFALDLSGQVTSEKNSASIQLDDVTLSVSGSEVVSMRLAYAIGAYEPHISPEAPVMLADISQEELAEIASSIQANAYGWIIGLATKVPALAELL